MKPLFILKMGSTFPRLMRAWGDFEDWILAGLSLQPSQVVVIDVRNDGHLPAPRECAGVILAGSHSMVTDCEPWSERVAGWIPDVVESAVPLLGICYGHQLLAHAMGGDVGPNPNGLEFGTVEMAVHAAAVNDRLFSEIQGHPCGQTSHFQSVLKLPPGAICLASTTRDPHHVFAIGSMAWGLQFHPEYSVEVTQAYIRECSQTLGDHGLDSDQLIHSVTGTPVAGSLLCRFGEIVQSFLTESRSHGVEY